MFFYLVVSIVAALVTRFLFTSSYDFLLKLAGRTQSGFCTLMGISYLISLLAIVVIVLILAYQYLR